MPSQRTISAMALRNLPAPDDLKAWKTASNEATRLALATELYLKRFGSEKAFVRYFDHHDFEYVTEGPEAKGIVPAYGSWIVYEYRPTATSLTVAETLLKENRPAAVAEVLAARARAHPSIYRITSLDASTGFIGLEDIIGGGRVTIHDKALSGCAGVDHCIPLSVFPAGAFHLADMAGPGLGIGQIGEAIDFLRENGMELTPEGQKIDAHLFGWLWDWRDEESDRPMPMVTNMDGDEMVWQTASFSIRDAQDVRRRLLERTDIEDHEDGTFDWFTKEGPAAKQMGGNVSLGRIELGDELILSTNSRQRLERARKWLEAIPGVRLRNVETRTPAEAMADRPMDEKIEEPEPEMTPELLAEVQELMTRQYMAWLDKPLPIFKGKTPRQMCSSPAGRQRVAILIRTIPQPMGSHPIEIPRAAMLRELGIANV